MIGYRIEEVARPGGDQFYTVVELVDGRATGGDHCWVRRRYAERAVFVYGYRPELHGRSSLDVAAAYRGLTGAAEMFDGDDAAYREYVAACEAEQCEPHTYEMWAVHGMPSGPLG